MNEITITTKKGCINIAEEDGKVSLYLDRHVDLTIFHYVGSSGVIGPTIIHNIKELSQKEVDKAIKEAYNNLGGLNEKQ